MERQSVPSFIRSGLQRGMAPMSDQIEISGLKFEPKIFNEGFKDPNGPNACTSRCCRHGVYLDPIERDKILAHAGMIEKYFDETQTKNHDRLV